MAKKKPEVEVEAPKAEIESFEIAPAKTVEAKSVEGFEGKNLHMIADGLFRYKCAEVKDIPKELFSSPAAKNYGLRKGDLVLVYDEDSVKNIVVKG